ncbi:MAG: hypothetical protein ACI814_002391, partial [Mariniblastus sp.]
MLFGSGVLGFVLILGRFGFFELTEDLDLGRPEPAFEPSVFESTTDSIR